MKALNSKTIQIGGGTVTLIVDVDLFTLRGEARDFVFELIEVFNDYENDSEEEKPDDDIRPPIEVEDIHELRASGQLSSKAPEPKKQNGRSYRITEEIKQRALELVKSGDTVSSAAIKLGVHRNTLRNAGIRFGAQSVGDVPEKPLTPGVCRECGGECSVGGTRCKRCYDKKVAENRERERAYKAEVAERKAKRETKKETLPLAEVGPELPDDPKESKQRLSEEEQEAYRLGLTMYNTYIGQCKQKNIEPGVQFAEFRDRAKRILQKKNAKANDQQSEPEPHLSFQGETDANKIASQLYNNHVAQCHKLGIRPDCSFAEFSADARAIVEWQKEHPGEPYVLRYGERVSVEDVTRTQYGHYFTNRA